MLADGHLFRPVILCEVFSVLIPSGSCALLLLRGAHAPKSGGKEKPVDSVQRSSASVETDVLSTMIDRYSADWPT